MASNAESHSPAPRTGGGDVDLLAEVDRRCDDYEAGWIGGAAPECEAALVDVDGPLLEPLLRELLLIEWQYRGGPDDAEAVRHAITARDALHRVCRSAGLELEAFLEEIAGGAAESIRPPKVAHSAHGHTAAFPPSAAPPPSDGGLHIRCPHCQHGVELLPDAPLDEVTCDSCGSAFGIVGSDAESATPTRIARFLLEERLGVGGFGAVWRARDPELDRLVALKLPRSGRLLPHETELFLREARAAAQLAHPNIVPLHEVGRDGESVFLVSELIHGEPLSERLKRERLSSDEAVELLAIVAEAVHYAHSRGVIHRDLKPSNVMLDEAGKPYVMDFGLAKREVGEITMTLEGQVLGTPAYMSPEQASGQVKWVDRRTDVYSLGVMLFVALTGELPFRGTAQSQLQQRQTDDPPSPRRLDPKTPLDLATVCLKCMERDPNRRYATAQELADELRRWRRGEPVLARPLSPAGRAFRFARRRPASAAALTLGAVLAIAGPTAAVAIYQRGAQIAARLAERDENIARSEAEIDRLNSEIDRLEGAGPRRAPAYFGAALPPWRRQLVETLLDERGEQLESSANSPRSKAGLGYLHAAAGRFERAATLLEAAIASTDGGDELAFRGECHEQLSEVLLALEKPEESEAHADEAAALRKQLLAESPQDSAAIAAALGGLATTNGTEANADEGDSLGRLRRVVALKKRMLDAFASDPERLYDEALAMLAVSTANPAGE